MATPTIPLQALMRANEALANVVNADRAGTISIPPALYFPVLRAHGEIGTLIAQITNLQVSVDTEQPA